MDFLIAIVYAFLAVDIYNDNEGIKDLANVFIPCYLVSLESTSTW